MNIKPIINRVKTLIKTKCFHIQQLDLTFSNQRKCTYERLKGVQQAVLIIPMLDKHTVLMIYEYSAGTNKYELLLPKGKIELQETLKEAANRELKEEVGYGARQLIFLKEVTLAPGYQSNSTHIILAQDLYLDKQVGDEPESLTVVKKSLNHLDRLVYEKDLTEGRSIAALYMAKSHMNH